MTEGQGRQTAQIVGAPGNDLASRTMTVEEAAAVLRIGRNMTYDAARRGELPVLRIGRRLLIIRHKLEELLGGPLTPASPIAVAPQIEGAAEETPFIGEVAELPSPDDGVSDEESKTPRADSDGLLNYQYVLANSARFKRVTAIYFLCSADEIVYVGQAIDVYARISRHIYEGTKRFSRVFMLRCDAADLDRLERAYIRKFRPRYNTVHNVIADAQESEAAP